MKRFKGTKGFICLVIIILLIVGYYYYLSNRSGAQKKEETIEISAVQEVLLRDLSKSYPPTPKEVVKYYCELTKAIHNEEIKEDELYALAIKIQELYDDELAANKSQEDYLLDLKSEITTFKDNGYVISNYSTSASTDVEYFEADGFSFAKLYGSYYIRVNTSMQTLEEVFLLRKDDIGHWKIYGWQPVVEQETDGE